MRDVFSRNSYPSLQNTIAQSPFPDVEYPRQATYSTANPMEPTRVPIDGDTAASSYHRRGRELDTSSWDDDVAFRLRTTANPTADYCDTISLCRRSPTVRKFLHRNHFIDWIHRYPQPFGVIWFVRDPCGIVCIVFTWFLILYAEFVVSGVILVQSPSSYFCWFSGSFYHLFAVMAVVSHFMAFATDPGTIPIGNATSDALAYMMRVYENTQTPIIRCPKCLCVKPPRSHHCRVCFRCVRKMDHHCPWINNCVGEGNQKYFVLFTFYICLQCICAIYMSVHFVIQCVDSDWELCQISPTSRFAIQFTPFGSCAFILGLVMESLVFGLFTLIMCISQLHSIAHDETGIESLSHSGSKNSKHSRWKNLTVSCGGPFTWRWFSPFISPPPVTPVFPGLGGYGTDRITAEFNPSSSHCDNSSRISMDTIMTEPNSTSVLVL